MPNIIVLGAGMVGGAIAIDVATHLPTATVIAVDADGDKLNVLRGKCSRISTIKADLLSAQNVSGIVKQADLVISAVPGFMGYGVLENVISAGKNVVDISFFPEDPFDLAPLASKMGVAVVFDAGVAPGMCNVIAGYYSRRMDIKSYDCLVGGLPFKREMPLQYKAPFSPDDVFKQEYIRDARYIENGQLVVKSALSDVEFIRFPEVGMLEAFNTDGLRSLLTMFPQIKNKRERTLRWPGHTGWIEGLKKLGFFRTEPLAINGTVIIPLDVTSRLLSEKCKLEHGEDEFTVMRVTMRGSSMGAWRQIVYDLFDKYDSKTDTSSMARTTGYTCSAIANLVLNKKIPALGMFPPEIVGTIPGCFEFIMGYLRERNVIYRVRESAIQ